MQPAQATEARLRQSVCVWCRTRYFQDKLSRSGRHHRPFATSSTRTQASVEAVADQSRTGSDSSPPASTDNTSRWSGLRSKTLDGSAPARSWGRLRPIRDNEDAPADSSVNTGLPGTYLNGQQSPRGTFDDNRGPRPPRFRQAPVLDNPHLRSPIPRQPETGPRIKRSFARSGPESGPIHPPSSRPLIRRHQDRQSFDQEQGFRRVDLSRNREPFVNAKERRNDSVPEKPSLKRSIENGAPRTAANDTQNIGRRPWGQHLKTRESYGTSAPEDRESTRMKTTPHAGQPSLNVDAGALDEGRHSSVGQTTGSRWGNLNDFSSDFVGFQNGNTPANAQNLRGESVSAPLDLGKQAWNPADNVYIDTPASSANGQEPGDSAKARRRAEKFASEDQPTTEAQRERTVHTRQRRNEVDDEPAFRTSSRVEKPGRRSQQTRSVVARVAYDSSFDRDDAFDDDRAQARKRRKDAKKEQQQEKEAQSRKNKASRPVPIEIPPFVSIQNLAALLRVRPEDFSYKLEELGFKDVSMDYVLNAENAGLIAMEYNFEPTVSRDEDVDLKPRLAPADKSILPQRPPIVTIMGHVDHGKTTLLDYLRHSSVAASEFGGITQHIGAFSVPLESHDNRLITFLDTPGHSAFLSMRQRGANVTDIVVLVVAADDSVKPQTIEAIKHSKAAGVQIIVAINKVDKEEADVYKVKQDLMRHEIEVEDFGGDIQAIEVSGKTGQGVDDLEEAIITLADVLDVRAESVGSVEGWVLEAATKRAGRTATVLVRRGTLRSGQVIVAGNTWARVRSLRNEAGVAVEEAPPGTPVEVDGWRDQPIAGDEVLEASSEQKASAVVEFRETRDEHMKALSEVDSINESRKLISERQAREKEALAEAEAALAADETATRREKMEMRKAAIYEANKDSRVAQDNSSLELFFIVKADVSGSAEAVAAAMDTLPLANQPVKVTILRSTVGAVSESDIALAAAAPPGQGFVLSFNQDVPQPMSALAARSGITLMDANIIYKVIDDVREKVEERLPPVITSRVTGEAEMLQAFEIKGEKKTTTRVAGCRVNNGIVTRNSKARVYRGGVGEEGTVVFDGTISSLRSQKKDVSEMRKGSECGISFQEWGGFEPEDIIQCYEEKSERRRLA